MDQSNSHQKYTRLEKVAEGTYGIVYKARNNKTKQIVAIKKFKNHNREGIPISFIRQMNIISQLKSQRIIQLIQTFPCQEEPLMVTQWMEISLKELIQSQKQFNRKKVFKQLVLGVKEMHEAEIVHRDLKPANVMMKIKQKQKNETEGNVEVEDEYEYEIKIIDFGMAKQMSDQRLMTNVVGSLFYRAPELILGRKRYGCEIDVWSLGCIFYEILTGSILFKGDNDLSQLKAIIEIVGMSKQAISDKLLLKMIQKLKISEIEQGWNHIKSVLSNEAFDLLRDMIEFDAQNRLSCEQVLENTYFL